MAFVKRMVCLSNSRKMMGTCVAGKEATETNFGVWVRPVSHRPKQEVSLYERQYPDGNEISLLDIVDISLQFPCPFVHQTENWLLDPRQRWKLIGRIRWSDLVLFADKPRILWINGPRTLYGLNDRVRLSKCKSLGGSLYLLHIKNLRFHVFTPGTGYGKAWLRVHAEFTYAGINYRMWTTDPVMEAIYKDRGVGIYSIGECFVTVSLSEPHDDGYCYKLVAAVMTPGMEGLKA
jgi:hypothetical protein